MMSRLVRLTRHSIRSLTGRHGAIRRDVVSIVIVAMAATAIFVVARPSSGIRHAIASHPAQVFPADPRIHLPLGLSNSAPIHSTGAPPPPSSTPAPTSTATPTASATFPPTVGPTATATLAATPALTVTPTIHVLLPDETFEDFPFDPLTILAAGIEGDTIELSVRYGGGCEDHDFTLLAGRAFMESFPLQADVRLSHNANGDLCRALIFKDLQFDLEPLKKHFKASGDMPGPLLLRLRGWDTLLRYDFP